MTAERGASTRAMCQMCGRPVEDRAYPGEPMCTPLSCPMWSTTAVYDHATEEWLPVDRDGFALDGKPMWTPR